MTEGKRQKAEAWRQSTEFRKQKADARRQMTERNWQKREVVKIMIIYYDFKCICQPCLQIAPPPLQTLSLHPRKQFRFFHRTCFNFFISQSKSPFFFRGSICPLFLLQIMKPESGENLMLSSSFLLRAGCILWPAGGRNCCSFWELGARPTADAAKWARNWNDDHAPQIYPGIPGWEIWFVNKVINLNRLPFWVLGKGFSREGGVYAVLPWCSSFVWSNLDGLIRRKGRVFCCCE